MQYMINLKDFGENNRYVGYFVTLKEQQYTFKVRWSGYCNCAFLDIEDMNGEAIIMGRALVNNLKIRNNKLPYILYFRHINNKTYEPRLDNLSEEFAIFYDDGEVVNG